MKIETTTSLTYTSDIYDWMAEGGDNLRLAMANPATSPFYEVLMSALKSYKRHRDEMAVAPIMMKITVELDNGLQP